MPRKRPPAAVALALFVWSFPALAQDPANPPAVAPAPAPAPAPSLTQGGGFAPPAQPSQRGAVGADPTGDVPSPLPPPGHVLGPDLTSPDTASPTPHSPVAPKPLDTGHFEFGSYGRVRVASDGRGGTGRQANIVSHGDRLDEDSYAELELRREDTFAPNVSSKVVATLALFPPFFHFSGNAQQQIAIRNLYAQGTYDNYTMWVGSRMYRGDDIYLLDWWPLDNQNTIGGGAGGKWGTTSVAAHVGMQRLDNPYQYEQITSVAPLGFGSTNVTYLDRPRTVETLKITQLFPLAGKSGYKLIAYGEAHEISAGSFRDTNLNIDKPYPSDTGWLAGAEFAYWTGERDTFIQVFARHARGLAAYDPLAVPLSFANDKTTGGSSETLFAVGGNYEIGSFGLLLGSYLRFFRDGSPSPTSTQKYDEGIFVARPQLYIGEHWGVALEGSYQARRYGLLNPNGDAPLTASVFRGGIIPYFSPSGRGSYKRPQIRLLYVATARDSGARTLYPQEDVFSQRKVEHFIGMGAEWWFNSSSYP